MKNWNQVKLVPEFNEQGVACYKLAGGNYVNEYYVVSEADTRKLLNTPEIVGYEVYDNDSRYASTISVLTTLGAIVTMPLMVLVFQMVM